MITLSLNSVICLTLRVSLNVIYNPSVVKVSEAALISSIRTVIFNYVEEQSQDFNTSISYSKIQKQILDSVPGIESISLSPALEYRFLPTSDVSADYQFEFKNPIFRSENVLSPVWGVSWPRASCWSWASV